MNIYGVRELWPSTVHGSWMDQSYTSGLVSVIIPSYNRANLLLETLDSVRMQSYRPIEAIVIDDGSTDDTHQLFERWAQHLDAHDQFRARYFFQRKIGGPAARNRGLIESQGEFIQFLDSDDLLHPKKLALHVQVLQTLSACDYVWSDLREFLPGFKPTSENFNDQEVAIQALAPKTIATDYNSIPWNVLCGLFRRTVLVANGPWNENLIRWQDVDYVIRFASLHPSYVYLGGVLYYMRVHEQGRIQDLQRQKAGISGGFASLASMEQTLERSGNRNVTVARSMSNFYLGLATLAAQSGTRSEVRRAIVGALRHRRGRSFNVKVTLFWMLYRSCGARIANYIFSLYTDICKVAYWRKELRLF